MEKVGQSGRSMGRGIEAGANAGTVAVGTLTRVLAPLLAAIAAIKAAETALSFNNMRQQSEMAFETMLGSAEKAKTMVQDIIQFAAVTPFEVKGLTEATQKLLAFGFQAKDVLPMLQSVGDAMSGLGMGTEGIDRAVRALGQMAARGKVASQEMMQLTELGIPAWQALADAIGTDTGTAMAMVERGTVDAATGINAVLDLMDTKFAGLMEKQSHTLGGLASTIKDTFAQTIGGIAEPAVNRLTAAMEKITQFTGTDEFKKWVQDAAQAVDNFLTALGPVVQFLMTDVPRAFSEIGDAVSSFIGGDFSRVEALFKSWASHAANWLSDAQDELGPKADAFFDAIRTWVEQNGPALEQKFTQEWVPAASEWAVKATASMIQKIAQELPKLAEWIVTTGVPAMVKAGYDLGEGLVHGIARGVADIWRSEAQAIMDAANAAAQQIAQMVTGGSGAVGGSWDLAVGGSWGVPGPLPMPGYPGSPGYKPPSEPTPPATTPARLQRGYINVPGGGTVKEEDTKKAAETAIMGFMEALQANRADMMAQFGQLGADGASALATAISQNTAASGGAVARAMESLLIQAQEAGVENWRQLGDDLAGAFHEALISRTEEAQQRALTMLTTVTAEVAGARAATAINEAIDKASQAITEAQDKAQEQVDRLVEAYDASEALREKMDAMNEELRRGLEKMQDTQQRIADQITAGRSARDTTRQYGREDLLTGESREQARADLDRNNQRRMTALQQEYAQRVADIQRRGGPQVGTQLSDAARQYQEQIAAQSQATAQQRADMQERFALEDKNRERQRQWAAEDAAQRMADIAADKERLKSNQAALEVERARLQAPIDRLQLEQREKTLAQQIADIRKNEYETILRRNEALAETLRLEELRAARATGSTGGGGSAPTPESQYENLEVTDVNMDGEKVGTLTARHTVNRLQTATSVMGGA